MLLSARKSFFFTLPGLFFYSVFVVLPIIFGFYLSLTDMGSFVQKLHFVGLSNYLSIFAQERFLNSLRVTVFFVVITAVAINIIALLIAILIDASTIRYLNSVARIVIYLPAVLTPILVGFIWYYIYKLGIPAIFQLLGLSSLADLEFLGPSMAIYSVMLTTVWLNVGVAMLIYVSAFIGIDPNLIMAASIDGAGQLRRLLSVKLPLIAHAFTINFVNTLIFSFKQFDQIFSMTRGGPGNTTETLSLYIYYAAFYRYRFGLASAAAYVLFILVMIVSLFIIVSFSKRTLER